MIMLFDLLISHQFIKHKYTLEPFGKCETLPIVEILQTQHIRLHHSREKMCYRM